jgi:hypothetical protein
MNETITENQQRSESEAKGMKEEYQAMHFNTTRDLKNLTKAQELIA